MEMDWVNPKTKSKSYLKSDLEKDNSDNTR